MYIVIYRLHDIKKISLFKGFIAFDALNMFELALLGGFAHTATSIRYRRYHYSTETYGDRLKRHRKGFSAHTNFIDYISPYANVAFFLFKAIKKSSNTFSIKAQLTFLVMFSAPLRYLASRGKQL